MSFIARKNVDDPLESVITAEQIINPIDRDKDYFCPGCSCVFRYRAASSNARAAHFFRTGEHTRGCWMPFAESITGKIDMSAMESISLRKLYDALIHSKERAGKGKGTVGGGAKGIARMNPCTIRNLYKFCCYHDNNHCLGNGLKVKDVFVGRKTSFLYIRYVSGLHLIECQYRNYDSTAQCIYFSYPFQKNMILNIQLHFRNKDLFNRKVKQLQDQKAPVLIYSDWKTTDGCVYTEIFTSQQIVPLGSRRV